MKRSRRPRSFIEKELSGGQHCIGCAEEVRGLARLGEDARGSREQAGLLADALEIRVEAGEDDDAAGRQLFGDLFYEGMAVFAGHGDVAKEEIWLELASALERGVRRVSCPRLEATLGKDQSKCVRYETFIIHNQDTLHIDLPYFFLAAGVP
jgi:hypothetical protein